MRRNRGELANSKQNTKVYIDGANIFYTQKTLSWSVDWKKTKKYLNETWNVIEMRYYTGVKKNDEKMASYIRSLDYVGITAVTKPLKKIKSSSGILFKSNFDVEMTTDILLDRSDVHEIILFTGDSDFHYLTQKLQSLGKKVIVFSSRRMLSWELKLSANIYFFLEDIKKHISR